MASLEAGRFIGRVASPASGFRIDFVDDWKLAIARWSGAGQETAFQHPLWFEAWYGAFAEASPLIAIVTDSVTERPVALVPLILRVSHGVRIVEFADLNVTDYNAPILRVGAGDLSGARGCVAQGACRGGPHPPAENARRTTKPARRARAQRLQLVERK